MAHNEPRDVIEAGANGAHPPDPARERVGGGRVTFTPRGSGGGLAGHAVVAATISGGSAAQTVSANATAGNYTVTASVPSSASTVSFALTNFVPDFVITTTGNAIVVTGSTKAVYAPQIAYADLLLTKPVSLRDLADYAETLTAAV
mgnify:CR=1 FL=1